jgi:Ca-activated chloride channel family protein
MAIASFSGNAVQVEVPFTPDREALEEAISLWEPSGTTALYDAVSWIPEITLEGRELRRVAVLVTDGADNASRISPNEARELVVRAQIPVYVLGFDTGSPYRLRRSGEKVYRYADVLNLLAHMTGGKYFSVSKTAGILEVCREILAELQFQYLLGFPAQAESSEALHRIEVELVDRPQWFVRSRRHYFGGSPVRQ